MTPERNLKKKPLNLPKIEDLGFFRRIAVKSINMLQKATLKLRMYSIYYALFKLHFKIYLGKNLVEEIANDTFEGETAIRRHGRLVIKTIFKDKDRKFKNRIYRAAKNKFKKDMLLKAKL